MERYSMFVGKSISCLGIAFLLGALQALSVQHDSLIALAQLEVGETDKMQTA